MPNPRKLLGKTLGREAFLLTVPILALIAFGFVSLHWEKRAQEEELRARCLALADPLRRDLFMRLAKAGYLIGKVLPSDIDAVPTPAETSDSQTKFTQGDYQSVLGDSGALSEAGLPLRPLAAIRLIRTEENPNRLEELAKVIAAEPSFITARLLGEAENRHKQLGLPLPPVLKDWENQLQRNAVATNIFKGRDPKEFLPDSKGFRWIHDSQLLIKTPEGYALVSKTKVMLMVAASCDSIATALPQGIAAKVQLLPTLSDQLPEFAFDSGVPPVRFVIDDLSALDRNSNLRRGFFIAFLIIAAGLSGAGLVVLLRSVSRERELAERKGNLIAAVSHEMRTPVASIRLLTENLSTGAANTEERRASHLGQLLEQSERLSTLVENVLNYSKRVSGRAEWKTSPIDVDKLLQNAATQFAALAESRKVSLRWGPCEFSTQPMGDTNALVQALANLIDNALKQSPPDSELSFGASPNSSRLEGWCLWVSDAGPGVPKEERKKIFEAFYRVGPELRRETKGTGLGLALVQQVAQAHGGEALCLASKSGGARFEIHLPYSPPNND